MKRIFTLESPEDKKILREVIRDSDPEFIRWALEAILKWRNEELPEPLWHIHGSKDEILPIRYTNPTHTVHKGTHLMVLSRSNELNRFLHEVLSSRIADVASSATPVIE